MGKLVHLTVLVIVDATYLGHLAATSNQKEISIAVSISVWPRNVKGDQFQADLPYIITGFY